MSVVSVHYTGVTVAGNVASGRSAMQGWNVEDASANAIFGAISGGTTGVLTKGMPLFLDSVGASSMTGLEQFAWHGFSATMGAGASALAQGISGHSGPGPAASVATAAPAQGVKDLFGSGVSNLIDSFASKLWIWGGF